MTNGKRRHAVWTQEVDDEEAGCRLDVFLVARVPGMSRRTARRLADEGKLWVGGRRARKGRVLRAGETVTLDELPAPHGLEAVPEPEIELAVVYEDRHLVAVDKPAGMPSHPLRAEERGTLAGALLARYPEMAHVGYARREPGIVHRLDTDTSGLLLAARDAETFARVRDALSRGAIDKRYEGLCHGHPHASRRFTDPLVPDRRDRRRMRIAHEAHATRGPDPVTEVLEARPLGELAWVSVRAPTARRHQIRVHLAAAGHPLAGDALYGGPAIEGLERHALHAASMVLPHPYTGRWIVLHAPFPTELGAILARLER